MVDIHIPLYMNMNSLCLKLKQSYGLGTVKQTPTQYKDCIGSSAAGCDPSRFKNFTGLKVGWVSIIFSPKKDQYMGVSQKIGVSQNGW